MNLGCHTENQPLVHIVTDFVRPQAEELTYCTFKIKCEPLSKPVLDARRHINPWWENMVKVCCHTCPHACILLDRCCFSWFGQGILVDEMKKNINATACSI